MSFPVLFDECYVLLCYAMLCYSYIMLCHTPEIDCRLMAL